MSTIDDAIVARAASQGALTALIGAPPNMRFYPIDSVPQNSGRPYVTYQQVSGPRIHAMGSDPGVVNPRFQFSVWSDTSTEAKDVGVQVMACFRRWRDIVLGVDVLDSFLENEFDAGRDPATLLFQRIIDFLIWHRE